MKNLAKIMLAVILCLSLFTAVGCDLSGNGSSTKPTPDPKPDVATADGTYTLVEKTVAGLDVTERFLSNVITLKDGAVTWTEITMSGSEVQNGTYTDKNNVVSVKIGLKTYEFATDEDFSKLEFSGKINRKNVVMNYQRNDDFVFSADTGDVAFTGELFGDDINENFYNYCPTVIMEGRTMHIWYCSNKVSGNVTDYVAYRKGTLHDDGKWSFSDKKIVLEHGEAGEWDSRHVCDPTVVKGEFDYNGERYNYLMAFLGCLTSNNTKNEVGIAVAKSPEGPWIKPQGLNPVADFYSDFGLSRTDSSLNADITANNSWGYGQPSLISADKRGQVILFYSAGVPTGTFTNAELWDFSDLNNPSRLNKLMVSNKNITNASGGSDVINNADFTYDPQTGRLYCVKEDFGYPTDSGITWIAGSNTVFYVDIGKTDVVGSRLFVDYQYSWTMAGKIDSGSTGFKRNHNMGIVTDEYGYMLDSLRLPVIYTMSMTPQDFPDWNLGGQWPALHTYRLHGIMLDIEG